jgi:hypothetical protein
MLMNSPLRAGLLLAGVAAAVPGPGLAQVLEEVVVTAERRETTLQDTPISIVALFTPNLAINGSRGYGNNQPTFSIRGIAVRGRPREFGITLQHNFN